VTLSDTYLHPLAHQVGQIAMAKHAAWHLEAAAVPAPVATLATGVDGTTMPVVGEAYKEVRWAPLLGQFLVKGHALCCLKKYIRAKSHPLRRRFG
jgi:hypothetical protein